MILGIGVDLVEIQRIRDALERFGVRFQERIFTEGEIAFCESRPDRCASYAARFAAKEAFAKALGTGLRGLIAWREIQVHDNERSRPTISVTGRAAEYLKGRMVHLSLTHTKEHAAAVVVILA